MPLRFSPILTLAGAIAVSSGPRQVKPTSTLVVRVNQLGYLPNAPKTAVACVVADSLGGTSLAPSAVPYTVEDTTGRVVQASRLAQAQGAFGPCTSTFRLNFSAVRAPGRYRVVAAGVRSPVFRVDARVYAGAADTLLYYMRQQRSGYNPTLKDSVHKRDGIIVDHPTRTGEFINVSGGWADAADYLQYVTTSATATYVMLKARADYPRAFSDRFAANGLPGVNGVDDALDEARHGLE